MAEKAERDLEIRTRRRDRKGKAGTKTSNDVGDEGKEEREGGREKMRSVFIHPVSTNYPCIQLFRESLSRIKCTRQSRKVIWHMINTLFLTTVAVEPTFVTFLQHSQTYISGLPYDSFKFL